MEYVKKIFLFGTMAAMLLAVIGLAVAQTPAADKAKDKSAAPFWVHSNNPALKSILVVRHEFDGVFSADVTPAQLRLLKSLGIKTEPVQLYEIIANPNQDIKGKPTCNNNGICEPELGENPSCEDCKNNEEEPAPEERTCYPDNQIPWGIVKVNGGSGGAGVDVAVLDTGVDKDHPDLAGRVVDCKDFTKRRVKSGCKDGNGHGTHVSGTILADGGADTLGIFGVAPEARLMAYKVCSDAGLCWADDIAAAIDYAAANGAEIVSMSLGGDTQSTYIKDAIDRNPEVLYVAAAGNDGPDYGTIDYPGAYIKVIAVAAFDSLDAMASWSSRGVNDGDWIIEEKEIEFATPGVSIESTYNDGCYAYMSGTSMSTPHVSGIAARDWQGTAADTRAYLQELAYNYTTNIFDYGLEGDDIEAGFGLPVATI